MARSVETRLERIWAAIAPALEACGVYQPLAAKNPPNPSLQLPDSFFCFEIIQRRGDRVGTVHALQLCTEQQACRTSK